MPIFEQGYRAWDGELARGTRVWAIARESVRTRLRIWVWLLTLAFLIWPFAVYGTLILAFHTALGSGFGFDQDFASVVVAPTRAYSAEPPTLVAIVREGSSYLYWDVLNSATVWGIILPAVCCGGMLASDRRTGALQIYFARPVTRRDYLGGKLAATAFFTCLVTAAPTLILWVEVALFGADASYVLRTWYMPFSIAAASAVYALWACALVLTYSSILKRPVLVAVLSIFTYLLLEGVGEGLADSLRQNAYRAIAPHYAIGVATAPLFGLETPDWLDGPTAAVPAVAVPLALLAFVWWRVRAVEVVT